VPGLADLVRPWAGTAYRHIPAGSRWDVRDLRFAGRRGDGRWHGQGQPTLYLASDQRVAIAEFARHLTVDRDGRVRAARRTVFSMHVALERTIDLREPAALGLLARDDAPACWLEPRICRAVASFLRDALGVEGLVVPSVAYLDEPARYNVVCFLEHLPADPRRFLTRVRRRATVDVTPLTADVELA
jgi:RES domain-containing protein